MKRLRTTALLTILMVPVALIYGTRLYESPIYLGHDEVFFALQAHSIASNAHDVQGRLLPLYFEVYPGNWFHPIIVYFMAVVFKLLPVSEMAVRLPTVCVGLIDTLLMYLVARQLFGDTLLALLAPFLLVLTPAHFIHARLGMDYLYPIPFVLGWLLCLLTYFQDRRPSRLFVAGLCLGAGFFSYLASVVMMPVYVLLTSVVLFLSDHKTIRPYLLTIAGFALPLMLLVPWLLSHPTFYNAFITRYHLYDPRLNPLQGAKELSNYTSLTERAYLYWEYFNPSFLFFSGGSNILNATRKAGVFLFVFMVLLPAGMYRLVTMRRAPQALIVMLGFATAPLAALLIDETGAIDRELAVVPFGVLIATYGLEHLLASRKMIWRAAVPAILALASIQFVYFYRDYFGDYRLRSAGWFEGNIRGAIEQVNDLESHERRPAIYFSSDIPFIEYHWRFYLLKYHREDLRSRVSFYSKGGLEVQALPAGALVVTNSNDPDAQRLVQSRALELVSVVREPNDAPGFLILRK